MVTTQEAEILQEVGIYEYRHPLSDSVAYKAELEKLRDRIKTMAKADGGAIQSATNWQVEGSAAKGKKLVRDISKLMLRAYNAEADNLVRGLSPPLSWTPPSTGSTRSSAPSRTSARRCRSRSTMATTGSGSRSWN